MTQTIKTAVKTFFDNEVPDLLVDTLGGIGIVLCGAGFIFGLSVMALDIIRVLAE